MSKTLITSRDSKGQQAVRVFEAQYDKAKLDEDRAQRLNEHPEFASRLKKLIDELSLPKLATQHPPVDEWFDLEIDNTIDPMDVVSTAGYDAKGWEFLGPKFEGKSTLQVKLVKLGYVKNLEDARAKAKAKGFRLLEGQARESLKQKFPRHNGRPIVFGGNEWRDPDGGRHVTCLDRLDDGSWDSDFRWSDDGFHGYWLWAVEQVA